MLILLYPPLPQRIHSKQLFLWRQEACQSTSHQWDVTGQGFVVTEEAEAPLSKFSVALRGSQKRALFYKPSWWSLELIWRTKATGCVSHKKCDCAPGKGRKELWLLLGRSSISEGSRNWGSWQPGSPGSPSHLRNHPHPLPQFKRVNPLFQPPCCLGSSNTAIITSAGTKQWWH